MRPRAFISHHSPHRLRIRIPSKHKDVLFFKRVEKALKRHPEVEQAVGRAFTSSLLILYRGGLDELKSVFKDEGLFELIDEPVAIEPLTRLFFDRVDRANSNMKTATNGQWDLPTLLATGLLGVSIYKITRGHLFPPAWALLGNAYMLLARNQAVADLQEAQEDDVA